MQTDPFDVNWQVELEGRSWGEEAWERYELTPEKLEMCDGKLLCSEEDRLRLLGLMLEGGGARTAVRFGDPAVWRAAVAELDDVDKNFTFAMTAAHRQWDNIAIDGDSEDVARYYAKWADGEYMETGLDGKWRGIAEICGEQRPGTDWSHWTSFQTAVASWRRTAGGIEVYLTRLCVIHASGRKTGAAREQWRERWTEQPNEATGRLLERTLLSSEAADPSADNF